MIFFQFFHRCLQYREDFNYRRQSVDSIATHHELDCYYKYFLLFDRFRYFNYFIHQCLYEKVFIGLLLFVFFVEVIMVRYLLNYKEISTFLLLFATLKYAIIITVEFTIRHVIIFYFTHFHQKQQNSNFIYFIKTHVAINFVKDLLMHMRHRLNFYISLMILFILAQSRCFIH